MEITYAGGSSFTVKAARTIQLDPQLPESGALTLNSTIQKKTKQIVNGPGEYEIGGVLIATVRTGPAGSQTLAHAVDVDGQSIAFLDRYEKIGEDLLDAFGRIDILVIRADDLSVAQAAVRDFQPRVVVPFGSQAAELCAALGLKDVQPQPRFSWNGVAAAPKAVLLKAPASRKRAA